MVRPYDFDSTPLGLQANRCYRPHFDIVCHLLARNVSLGRDRLCLFAGPSSRPISGDAPYFAGALRLYLPLRVFAYLGATLLVQKPLRIGNQEFSFPPFKLSLLQLAVSAADFALASLVLYVLLPHGSINYSTVLVSYLAAMIVVVVLHVPGGIGVLELVIIELLAKEENGGVTQAKACRHFRAHCISRDLLLRPRHLCRDSLGHP